MPLKSFAKDFRIEMRKMLKETFEGFKPPKGLTDTFKTMWKDASVGKMKKVQAVFKGMSIVAKELKAVALGPLNLLMSILDAFGAAQPVLEIFSAFIQMIGVGMMEAMMPAFEYMAELLQDKEFMDSLKDVGRLLGTVLSAALIGIVDIFRMLVAILSGTDIGTAGFAKGVITALFAIIGAVLASFIGMPWLGGLIGAAIGTMVGNVLGLAGGGLVTRRGVYELAEDEPEWVIPESKMGTMMGGGGGDTINVTITGGVFAQDERELAKKIAKKIRLYRF